MMLTESIRDPFAHLNAGFDQIEVKSAPLLGVTRFQRPRRTLADRALAAALLASGRCVLPVLALKLGSVLQLESRERRPVRLQFLAASACVLGSFWAQSLKSSQLRATRISTCPRGMPWEERFRSTASS